ncbi:type II toxin-antitoxin system antitoxin SocA domain-containing protein [Levilactobacillus fuyuanensis]|uniref:Type II toxin-antitoxin system antitoxin SocA domain-containing protein n=1 Tax=Levilactobacillus fuyuanensis TaxID=2486022 RepID=A0ABW4H5L1_9LACO|nr:type II toxin-antitoxin system antitoxin SocA domain-containing protein [Levilactobacillus fuyuanensis]
MTSIDYVFTDKKNAAAYLYSKLENKTPIKIQKGLYFLWAFYAATYGNINYDVDAGFSDGTSSKKYPSELFKPDFEAWRYGPVDNEIWAMSKHSKISDLPATINTELGTTMQREIELFMDDLIKDIDNVNDFGLVERSHRDSAWREAFDKSNEHDHQPMDAAKIKEDYVGYVQAQSEL